MHSLFNETVKILGAAVGIAASANAVADYQCTIEKRIGAQPESPAMQATYEKAHIGKQFAVERKTGIMSGALKNAFLEDPQIVDDGASGKAYRVVSVVKPGESDIYGSGIYALIIDLAGSAAQKPFVFLENGAVYFGRCEQG